MCDVLYCMFNCFPLKIAAIKIEKKKSNTHIITNKGILWSFINLSFLLGFTCVWHLRSQIYEIWSWIGRVNVTFNNNWTSILALPDYLNIDHPWTFSAEIILKKCSPSELYRSGTLGSWFLDFLTPSSINFLQWSLISIDFESKCILCKMKSWIDFQTKKLNGF